MSKSTITIDPVTRIEGHLGLRIQHESGVVTEARCSGTLFRGIEIILRERDPRDAPIITQRICGVCPQAHATASAMAVDEAFGIADKVPPNGMLLRDIMLASNFIQSHVLHFYHLAALDYVDVTAVKNYKGRDANLLAVKDFIGRGQLAPFVPRFEGDYRLTVEENIEAVRHYAMALEVRKNAHEMLAIFGGKMPHQCTVAVGGVTTQVTAEQVVRALSYARSIAAFVENVYLPDILLVASRYPDYFEIGVGCKRYLACGGFGATGEPLLSAGVLEPDGRLMAFDRAKIAEQVVSSRYTDASAAATPFDSSTEPQFDKGGAYSWLKSPRYEGKVCEVGPLARLMVSYAAGNKTVKDAVDGLLKLAKLDVSRLSSVLGRHAARALEARLVAGILQKSLLALRPGEPCNVAVSVPDAGRGAGVVDAPRGMLSHWLVVEGGKIKNYQAVVPTTWNGSPRDAQGQPGPIEQAVEKTRLKDPANPFEVVRIVRSFDPCLACAVHVLGADGATRRVLPVA
jgi:hydrogenase large subunit